MWKDKLKLSFLQLKAVFSCFTRTCCVRLVASFVLFCFYLHRPWWLICLECKCSQAGFRWQLVRLAGNARCAARSVSLQALATSHGLTCKGKEEFINQPHLIAGSATRTKLRAQIDKHSRDHISLFLSFYPKLVLRSFTANLVVISSIIYLEPTLVDVSSLSSSFIACLFQINQITNTTQTQRSLRRIERKCARGS